jgi:hypothetical protein
MQPDTVGHHVAEGDLDSVDRFARRHPPTLDARGVEWGTHEHQDAASAA